TYEVSPLPWVDPLCHCVVQEDGEADISILQEASLHSIQGAVSASVALTACSKGLAGVLEGDLYEQLDALADQVQSPTPAGQVLEIACDQLIRLDFVAASSVLNWAAEMQEQGYCLKFTQLHQLVAMFFHIIGIDEHAEVEAAVA
ncbi:MAG: STAS domain-containing protein, partial [Comamonas sp.]